MKLLKQLAPSVSVLVLGFLFFACEDPEAQKEKKEIDRNLKSIEAYLAEHHIEAERSPNGYFYKSYATSAIGQKANVGDEVTLNFSVSRLDDILVDSASRFVTYYSNYRFIPYLSGTPEIIREFYELVGAGDSISLFLPYNLRANTPGPSLDLPLYTPFRIDIRLRSVMTEVQQIQDYIDENNVKVTETTESGLRFGLSAAMPDSAELEEGSTYSVSFLGKRMDNSIFQQPDTMDVSLGTTQLVRGFSEGLAKMRVGEKANVLMPSSLGYGVDGSGCNNTSGTCSIYPYSPLFFEVQVISKK